MNGGSKDLTGGTAMIYTALTKKAMKVAYEAHHGQTDRSGTPYIFHPFHVAEQMDDELSVCTALLHDVIEDTEITFEYELPTEAEFRKRIRTVLEEYPYLIYEDAGNILGYAYAHRHLERAAYQWNVELTVYLHPDVVSRGIGRRLYEELLRILTEQGICNAYSLITRPNEKSEKLHEAMGFTLMGVLKNTGYKNGKWRDVSWYEKQLNPYPEHPVPFRKIDELYRKEENFG